MVETTSNSVLWYFRTGDPWTRESNGEWTKYRDIEMQIIEEGYQRGNSEVLLDKYRINFKELIQFNRNDQSKQRPVRRQVGCDRQECLREERFHTPPPFVTSPSYGDALSWCSFLSEWFKLPAGRKAILNFPSSIDACINGILEEAIQHQSNSETEASWMADQLRACKTKPRSEASKVCIHLYTRESFLYRVLNTALRNLDYSKLETLGPLCFLIRDYSRACTDFIGTVYRGAELPSATIVSYKQAIGTWRTWSSFTSTSKNKQMAEIRGNTLFIISITDIKLSAPVAYDIAEISHFPEEEEVLLPAGICFQIISVEQDAQLKYKIQIKV